MSDKETETKQAQELKNQQISQLKCDIFDIIRQQEIINNKFNELQNFKSQKIQELQKLEQS